VHASALDDRVRALAHVCLETPAMLEQVVDAHRHTPTCPNASRLLLAVLDLVNKLGLPVPLTDTMDVGRIRQRARLDVAIKYALDQKDFLLSR
jgi:hypothetical protein